jgi:hypothetical protein
MGGEEKKNPKKKPTWVKERIKKGQLELTTLVNPRTRREKNSYCHVQKNCQENRDERKNFKNEKKY